MDFFTNIESGFSPMVLRRLNTWYSVADGNWSDPNTWMSNRLDKKVYTSPQAGDNVVINNTVTLDSAVSTTTVLNNLTINYGGNLTIGVSSKILTINGNLQSTGAMDFGNKTFNLNLYGNFNNFTNLINPTNSVVSYLSTYSQDIQPVTYYELILRNGIRNVLANLTINGTFRIQDLSTFNLYGFNLTVGLSTEFLSDSGGTSTWNTTGGNTMTFIGNANLGAQFNRQFLNLIGVGITMEFRGGLSLVAVLTEGTVAWNFTTNSQTWNISSIGHTVNGNVTIFGAITVSINDSANSQQITQVNGVINGTVAGSTLKLTNAARFYISNATAPMATGVFDPSTFGTTSCLGFAQSGNYTIPYTTFAGTINITGGGTKTLSGNTTLGGGFSSANQFQVVNGTLECAGFTLSVNGDTFFQGGVLSQNGAGALLFIGKVTLKNNCLSLSGNPTVELRGGLVSAPTMTGSGTGTSAWSFTTNNQTVDLAFSFSWPNAWNIVGNIQVTLIDSQNSGSIPVFSSLIQGSVSGSTLILGVNVHVNYQNAAAPMSTGQLWGNQAVNTFIYGLSGNQDITPPSDATPGYKNLTLNGSGIKRLLGNVSVKGVYTLTGPATLNSNGFALTNP